MTTDELHSLVSIDWLARHLDDPDLRILDGSWHLSNAGRDARREFRQGHIPRATFFDIDRISDPDSALPHMFPSERDFSDAVGVLGVGNDCRVVVYDAYGLFSAARVWWMFRAFGHECVAVLDGGLPAWVTSGHALETGETSPRPTNFRAELDTRRIWSLADVRANIDSGEAVVLDARPAARFHAQVPEPRPGLRSGHIPGALSIPADRITDPDTGRVRSVGELADIFRPVGERPAVCSCGSGITACALAFGLQRIGHDDVALYDGSWVEWGGRDDTPIESDA